MALAPTSRCLAMVSALCPVDTILATMAGATCTCVLGRTGSWSTRPLIPPSHTTVGASVSPPTALCLLSEGGRLLACTFDEDARGHFCSALLVPPCTLVAESPLVVMEIRWHSRATTLAVSSITIAPPVSSPLCRLWRPTSAAIMVAASP